MRSAIQLGLRVLPMAALVTLAATRGDLQSGTRTGYPDWLRRCAPARVDLPALCGKYSVWENRETKRGRRIALNVVVLPAKRADKLPDPVFYLDGGPGAGATRMVAPLSRRLASVRDRRDLVFVDVRGTGDSHALECPALTADAPLQSHFDEFLPDAYVRDCLRRQQADVGRYTNPIAMDDLDEVRAALGYERINLFGISGGTRQAQVYMRRHTESVRSAVLKGVAPMDMENPLPHPKALEAGVKALIEACAAESACRSAYPDLARDWELSKQRFARGPVEAEMRHPRTGRSERVRIGRGVYADGVRHTLYNMAAARALPAMIHAAARGDFRAFAQMELELSISYEEALAYGTFLTVTCAEDLRFVDEADIRRATDNTFLGDYRVRRQLAACRIWGRGSGVDENFQRPVHVATPTLLISGQLDTTTPPDDAERVARNLPNGRHIIFPNQSHDSPNPACENRLIADFIRAGNARALDTSCVATTRRPPFQTPR